MDTSRPATIDDATAADFAALGVTVEAEVDEEACEVWDVNWSSATFFFSLETQWHCVSRGMTGILEWLGLDYAAVAALLQLRYPRRSHAAKTARLMADLRMMEATALPIMNEASVA